MALHEPFGHLQHKLWPKERSEVKLAIWLPTTKSQESTRFRCVQVECGTLLESSRGELQLWFRSCSDPSLRRGVMNIQSPGNPNWDNFETPLWESWEKEPFGCRCSGELQRILYGGRWWLPLSSGRGESNESKVARGLSQHQKGAKWVLTNFWLDLDAGMCNWISLSLFLVYPGAFSMPLSPPLMLEAESMPWVQKFRNLNDLIPTWG